MRLAAKVARMAGKIVCACRRHREAMEGDPQRLIGATLAWVTGRRRPCAPATGDAP